MAAVLEASLEMPGCIVSRQTGREQRRMHREEDVGSEEWLVQGAQGCDWERIAVHWSLKPRLTDRRVGPALALHCNLGFGRQSKAAAGGHWLSPPTRSQPQVSGPPCPHLHQDKAPCPLLRWEGSHSQDCGQDALAIQIR